jgi:hypothetical protein
MRGRKEQGMALNPGKILERFRRRNAASDFDAIGEFVEMKAREFSERGNGLEGGVLKDWVRAELVREGSDVDEDVVERIARRMVKIDPKPQG